MGFWIQYKALMYKNWVLWKRKLIGSLFELLLPIFTMIIIGLLRKAVPPTHRDAQSFIDQQSISFSLDQQTDFTKIPFKDCMYQSGNNMTSLSYSIISTDQNFVNYMVKGISTQTLGIISANKNIPFSTLSAFENYVTGSNYENEPKVCFAVYLNEVSPSNYELELRYNITEPIYSGNQRLGTFLDIFNLDSNPPYDDLIVAPTPYLANFYDYGFLSLMGLTNNYFLQEMDPNGFIEARFYPMRFDNYVDDSFLVGLGLTLVFFLIISFLIPVCRFLAAIVNDKENRTKEMMMMMGLHSSAYWCSWITYYLLIYTIICIIITIIILGMGVFNYSNGGLIFLYFWLFAISCIAFSIFLSVFFSKSRSAVLIGVPIFLGTYFVSFAVLDPLVSLEKKAGASLLPCVAFSLVTDVITFLESGQQGMTTSNSDYQIGNYTHGLYFGMIIVDIVYLSLFAAYLEAVWPTEWGVKRPWYFLCTREFWYPKKVKVDEVDILKKIVEWGDAVEGVDSTLEDQKSVGKAMVVRGLGKRFSNKVAVEELNLDIYEGQIFALLGHNGAGKTTTISMLTGLIPPSTGEMAIHGNLLSKDLGKIREGLGVCPQQNILFPDLTPLEHMEMFCKFKGISDPERIKQLSDQKLMELELTPKKNIQAKFLSGGQKRKLQLALALIGDSKIVLLDEPTSGMDLTARRHMWDMLKNNKSGRIIILTTHYMEEADVLADRIAIMSQGTLRCCGSSLFLKSRYGVGYYLTLVRNQEAVKNTNIVEKFVKDNVDGSKMTASSHGEITFQLPSSSSEQFTQFFDQLDQKFEEFGLISYSMSATTLEEVFLRVARGDEEIQISENQNDNKNEESLLFEAQALAPKHKHTPSDESDFILSRDKQTGSLLLKHSKFLLKKRILSSWRDKNAIVCEIMIPIVLIIIGLALMLIPSILKNYGPYELTISKYSSPQQIFYGGNPQGYTFVQSIPGVSAKNSTIQSNLSSFSDLLFSDRNLEPNLVLSYYFDYANTNTNNYNITIFTCEKAYQSYPTAFATISNQILKSVKGNNFNLKVYNHPLPDTQEMNRFSASGSGFTGSLIFSLGFSFIPTGIVLFITKERENNIKHQHMISGVSLVAYWFTNFLWDCIKHIIPAVASSLIILAFQIDIYTSNSNDYGAMWVLMILGGIAHAPFSYVFSFFFKSHSTAQVVMLILSFITGSVFPSAVFVMYFFDSTRNAGIVISWILRVLPNFAFGWGVLNVGSKDQFATFLGRKDPYGSFDIQSAGGSMLVLGIMTVVYFLLVLLLELFETNPSCSKFISRQKLPVEEAFEHDDDVDKESQVANTTNPQDVQVNVKNLCKSFRVQGNLFTAVNKVSFNVNPEECFALLGVNGAGKTTTFKMLTGEVFSDQGQHS